MENYLSLQVTGKLLADLPWSFAAIAAQVNDPRWWYAEAGPVGQLHCASLRAATLALIGTTTAITPATTAIDEVTATTSHREPKTPSTSSQIPNSRNSTLASACSRRSGSRR